MFVDTLIKSVEIDKVDGDLIIKGFANTTVKDRSGDVIPKAAWDNPKALSNYLKNPIILANHDYSDPIGSMVSFSVSEKGLEITAKISADSGKWFKLIQQGIMRTFSVGFGILDAEYDSTNDTFLIKELELYEVSVVSVPCNPDSTFSVSKGMGSENFSQFKTNFISNNKEALPTVAKEKSSMENKTPFNLDELLANVAKISADAATGALSAQKAADVAEAKQLQEAASVKAAHEAYTKAAAKEAAKDLVANLETQLTKSAEAFATSVQAQQDKIIELQDEIKQVVASRASSGRGMFSGVADAVSKGINGFDAAYQKEVNHTVLLSHITKKGMFETAFGKAHYEKAVNLSSSIQVSSEGYETMFSTDLQREIQDKLVLANLFREITMNQASMVLPVQPNADEATWVAAAEINGATRTNATTGAEHTVALTEVTLKTFKLAAKSFITDETQEDAIIPLLDLIRSNLIEGHVKAIETAILRGTGTNQPKGLIPLAAALELSGNKDKFGGKAVTAAKFDGTVKVTAKMVHATRRKLGLLGMDVSKIALVISHSAYWDLLEDDAWANISTGGDNSAKLRGQVGAIYGLPIIVSSYGFESPAVGVAYGVMVYKENFVMPRQRGLITQTDYYVEKQQRVIVTTQRVGFQPILANYGVVAMHYAAA